MSSASTRIVVHRARLEPRRITDQERRLDAFLVGEAALGSEPVLAEEIAVVAQEQDEGVVELAGLLQRREDIAHALVDRGHHGGAQRISSSLPAWMPSSTLREASLTAKLEGLGPGRLLLHHHVVGLRVGPAAGSARPCRGRHGAARADSRPC
jgi:hypothetical protein